MVKWFISRKLLLEVKKWKQRACRLTKCWWYLRMYIKKSVIEEEKQMLSLIKIVRSQQMIPMMGQPLVPLLATTTNLTATSYQQYCTVNCYLISYVPTGSSGINRNLDTRRAYLKRRSNRSRFLSAYSSQNWPMRLKLLTPIQREPSRSNTVCTSSQFTMIAPYNYKRKKSTIKTMVEAIEDWSTTSESVKINNFVSIYCTLLYSRK